MSDGTATVSLVQRTGYVFDNHFGPGVAVLASDEPAPQGSGSGPSPVQLLGAAVGNCLPASLLFALQKFKQDAAPLRCEVALHTGRNEDKRLRVQRIEARLHLGRPAAGLQHLDRVLGGFEAYCTVTQSVAAAVPVQVSVLDANGTVLKSPLP